jgi:hypothetical protein
MDSLDEGHVDGADESTGGEVQDPVARAVITVTDEHATLGFWGKFVSVCVIDADVGKTTKILEVG